MKNASRSKSSKRRELLNTTTYYSDKNAHGHVCTKIAENVKTSRSVIANLKISRYFLAKIAVFTSFLKWTKSWRNMVRSTAWFWIQVIDCFERDSQEFFAFLSPPVRVFNFFLPADHFFLFTLLLFHSNRPLEHCSRRMGGRQFHTRLPFFQLPTLSPHFTFRLRSDKDRILTATWRTPLMWILQNPSRPQHLNHSSGITEQEL